MIQISHDEMREIGVFVNAGKDAKIVDRLQKSLIEALNEMS